MLDRFLIHQDQLKQCIQLSDIKVFEK